MFFENIKHFKIFATCKCSYCAEHWCSEFGWQSLLSYLWLEKKHFEFCRITISIPHFISQNPKIPNFVSLKEKSWFLTGTLIQKILIFFFFYKYFWTSRWKHVLVTDYFVTFFLAFSRLVHVSHILILSVPFHLFLPGTKYCHTSHYLNHTNGKSLVVNKKCAATEECRPDTVGCRMQSAGVKVGWYLYFS